MRFRKSENLLCVILELDVCQIRAIKLAKRQIQLNSVKNEFYNGYPRFFDFNQMFNMFIALEHVVKNVKKMLLSIDWLCHHQQAVDVTVWMDQLVQVAV